MYVICCRKERKKNERRKEKKRIVLFLFLVVSLLFSLSSRMKFINILIERQEQMSFSFSHSCAYTWTMNERNERLFFLLLRNISFRLISWEILESMISISCLYNDNWTSFVYVGCNLRRIYWTKDAFKEKVHLMNVLKKRDNRLTW